MAKAKNNTVKFREMYIRSMHLSNPEGSDPTITLNCSAAFDGDIQNEMGWGEIDPEIKSATLRGSLAAENMDIVPSAPSLKSKAVTAMPIKAVDHFSIAVKNDKEGEAVETELRLQIEIRSAGAEAILGKYIRHIGRGTATCKVSYLHQMTIAEQPQSEADQTSFASAE